MKKKVLFLLHALENRAEKQGGRLLQDFLLTNDGLLLIIKNY